MSSLKNRSIGVFDSGVGGLTVLKSIRSYLPGENIIYYGDTARVPYGNKSASTIRRFAREAMWFLMEKKVKMVVVACNTASSLAVPYLKKEYAVPVTGVIGPGISEAVRCSRNKRIGVIGTSSTIASKAYDKELGRVDRSCRIFSGSCPLFVPLVENRFLSGPIVFQIARDYLKDLKRKKIDTLVLGCTHYPLLKKVISRVMGDIVLVDSAHAVAKSVKSTLVNNDMQASRSVKTSSVKYYVSDDAEGFKKTASIFLREKIHVKKAVF